jgi:hypothetical protein
MTVHCILTATRNGDEVRLDVTHMRVDEADAEVRTFKRWGWETDMRYVRQPEVGWCDNCQRDTLTGADGVGPAASRYCTRCGLPEDDHR